MEALKTNKTLEEIHVGNLMVGCTVRLKSSGEMCTVFNMNGADVALQHADGKKDSSWTKPSDFDPIPAVIPVKQLRENTITSLDLSSKTLGVDGALILAALIKDNTSVQELDASANGLDQASKDYLTKAKPLTTCHSQVMNGRADTKNDSAVQRPGPVTRERFSQC